LVCQPNNRITWHNPAWCTNEVPCDWKDFKVDQNLPNVEVLGDKWATEDTNAFFYQV
jgi:hypothetical protein